MKGMKLKKAVLGMSFVMMFAFVGCGNHVSQSKEIPTDVTVVEETSRVNDMVIYVQDVSLSLNAIDKYSLSMEGEPVLKTYAFDNYYTILDEAQKEISLSEFAAMVNQSYSENHKAIKCRIVFEGKLIKQVYIEK